jgi:hypothetical protein
MDGLRIDFLAGRVEWPLDDGFAHAAFAFLLPGRRCADFPRDQI